MNILVCQDCQDEFANGRSDALRCIPCKKERRKLWQMSERGKEMRRAANRRVREAALAGYGGECSCCGEDTYEFLAIDHVNGGGRKEREILSTSQIARKVVNEQWPEGYQVLCHNCNQASAWYGQCPHEWKRTA